MATNIPMALRSADIGRFVHRAAQLEKVKPIVSYWCNYWVVNQILSRGLHTKDEECTEYATMMMDKLEQIKAENATNDAIVDDLAAQAYVEQFGLETFQRADNAMKANKVSRQTADTFQAAATFLDLLNIWGMLDEDVAAKIKYAKFHALRIAKAIKAGEDPNASNPAPETFEEPAAPALEPSDVEAWQVVGRDRQASVEDVPDEHDKLEPGLARTSSMDQSLHPSRASSIPRPPQISSPLPPPPEDMDMGPPSFQNYSSQVPASSGERKDSAGGGYFPSVPAYSSNGPGNPPPPAPPFDYPVAESKTLPSPHQFYAQPSAAFSAPRPSAPPPLPSGAAVQSYRRDDEAMAGAQRHARWAISALNFEDVNTAVKELRLALETLGAG